MDFLLLRYKLNINIIHKSYINLIRYSTKPLMHTKFHFKTQLLLLVFVNVFIYFKIFKYF